MSKAISQSDTLLATAPEDKMDPVFKEILAKNSLTPAGRKTVIFKLRNHPNGKVHLDGIDDVFDPETKQMRRIRILRGVAEIWQDKQEKIDPKYVDKNRISLTFIQGGIVLDETKDAHLIKAARLMNGNEGNPNRLPGKKRPFYEWDPAAQEKAAFEREMEEYKVVELAMSVPFEKAKKHALFLGVIITNEMGEIRGEDGIRALYAREAKKDPKRFRDSLDSKEVEIKYLLRRAIIEAKIDISTANIKWPAGGAICKLPHGREPLDYLVEFALLPQDESKDFLDRLQKLVF